MDARDFQKLQIGMYVTTKKKARASMVCSDFHIIKGFRNGGIILQPMLPDGTEAPNNGQFWEHHQDIDITLALYASDYRETIAIG